MSEENEEFLRRVSEAGAAGRGSAQLDGGAPSSPSKKTRRIVLFLLVLVALLVLSRPSLATLVVFEDGRILHVEKYEVVPDAAGVPEGARDERVTMTFAGGGTMTVSLDVVDRIVDDEYERPPAPPASALRIAAGTDDVTRRSLRAFSENPFSSPSPYSSQILAAAKEHKVDPAFIAAVIRAESNGVPTAVSRKGARGLMQLMPATARRLGVTRPFDPKENIRGGAAYLAELATRYGDTRPDLVLAAYNAGEKAVEEHKGIPPFRETREYVRRVLSFWASAAGTAAAGAGL